MTATRRDQTENSVSTVCMCCDSSEKRSGTQTDDQLNDEEIAAVEEIANVQPVKMAVVTSKTYHKLAGEQTWRQWNRKRRVWCRMDDRSGDCGGKLLRCCEVDDDFYQTMSRNR